MNEKPVLNRFLCAVLLCALFLNGCNSQAAQMVGQRPARSLAAVVEAYLQKYQPGPLPRLFQTTYVYDRNGVPLAELYDEGRRTWVTLAQISPHLRDATVATEDVTFYTNLGVDPLRIAAAAWTNSTEGRIVSGASTITMQLARNLFLGPEERYNTSLDRKVLEAGLAQELTTRFSKDEILEMYLNLLNYGNLAYGPEAAAQLYFGKPARDLTLAEATLLAGIPQQPAELDPFRNLTAVKRRQSIVLELLVRHEYLTKTAADLVFRTPIQFAPAPVAAPTPVAPHFIQYVIDVLDERLGAGYTKRSGFNLFTTLDLRMQVMAEKLVAERVAQGRERYNMNNAALVAMRPGSAEVLVMVGSADFADATIDGQVNVALMPRQPGSTLKPVLYATALDDLLVSPASILWDTPITYDQGGNQLYSPRNYDNKFHGLVTVRSALANSYNVPAVRLLDALGMTRALEGAHALGVRSLTQPPASYTLSLALGGHEVTLIELVTAYHTIANGGRYLPPEVAVTVLDSRSELLAPLAPPPPVPVITSGTAFLITDILSDNAARTPMFGANSPLQLSRPAAAKTGTTTSFRDNWTIGYTKYLLVGVWVGNSSGQPMRNTTGITGAAPLWRDFMEAVLNSPEFLRTLEAPPDEAAWAFVPPEDVMLQRACPPNLPCRTEGEYFTRAWLAAAGADGPLADMFTSEPTVPVHRDGAGRAVGGLYCSQPGGQERRLFRVSDGRGLAARPSVTSMARSAALGTDDYVILFYPDRELERLRKLEWARARGMEVTMGPCGQLQFYTVRPGDYWNLLAQRFNLSVGALQAANPQVILRGGTLRPADRLLVPNAIAIDLRRQAEPYTVQAGDTWSQIARRFNVPLRLLQAVNPALVRPAFLLQPGDALLIPQLERLEGVVQ
jgi:penicillin-binding protein 1C